MFMSRSTVDDLAQIRARLCELRAHEAALEMEFMENNDNGRVAGFHNDVVVERVRHQIFDIGRLPVEVRDDPRFYSERFTTRVRIVEKEPDQGWMPPLGDVGFDVIERG